jgi:hypothetical protein
MPNSYEHSFQHNLDDVIDASDAVLAIGTEKVDTITLKDRALSYDATIHGAMPSNGYFLGRIFDGDDDYLDCGDNGDLDVGIKDFALRLIVSTTDNSVNAGGVTKQGIDPRYYLQFTSGFARSLVDDGVNVAYADTLTIHNGKIRDIVVNFDRSDANGITIYVDGIDATDSRVGDFSLIGNLDNNNNLLIATLSNFLDGIIYGAFLFSELLDYQDLFNTIARLSLYSHNFEIYPNSDTSLTSVFPYTSGIITSGSFNKTDGLKCTSAGTIVFSNSFEFDGSEYITLVIDGVEYSGTTTVTQGTITATIAQGSNDITIEMGTNDVLEDIRVQFRSEV